MSNSRRKPVTGTDRRQQHLDWLSLVEANGPWLSLPVLVDTWPDLAAVDQPSLAKLRDAHADWQDAADTNARNWIDFLLGTFLDWRDDLVWNPTEIAALPKPEFDTAVPVSFALIDPGEPANAANAHLLGLWCEPGQHPAARMGDGWSASPVDRVAALCRHHKVPLGLTTDGRFVALVSVPAKGAVSSAVFDTVTFPEQADRTVLRAFMSLLERRRFFGVPDAETLPKLFEESLGHQEDITEALGVQVRRAVELLVEAIGRADVADRRNGGEGIGEVEASEVYSAAVAVMMRLVFLLFAEDKRLLPSDNALYQQAYSVSRLAEELEQRATMAAESNLAQSQQAWMRLLALFTAVHRGVDHDELRLPAYDGSIFDPERYAWLHGSDTPLRIDDRTVLHMLRSITSVWVSAGRQTKNRSLSCRELDEPGKKRRGERRSLSFAHLDVEQIGYVYEGLLSFEGKSADEVVVGLIGTEGREDEVALRELERLAGSGGLAATLAEEFKASGIGTAKALAKALEPLSSEQTEKAMRRLLAVTGGDRGLAERLLPFYGVIRSDLRGLPTVMLPDALYVTESTLRGSTGTHYTPRELAEQVVTGALEPLVYEPGPLQTGDKDQWVLKHSDEILELKVADIAMGSAAFLVGACRYLAERLMEAWRKEDDPRAVAEPNATDVEADAHLIEARRLVIEHCLYGVDINPMAVEMAKLSLWLVSMDPGKPFTFLDDRLVCGDSLLGIGKLDELDVKDLRVERDVAKVRELREAITALPDDSIAALAKKRELLAQAEEKTRLARLYADLLIGSRLAGVKENDRDATRISEKAVETMQRVAKGGDAGAAEELAQGWLDTDRPFGAFKRECVHWPLVFPEVFGKNGGFDAVIGNPPFLGGQKLTGAMGPAYREYLVEHLGGGVRGSADLVAYFLLRAHGLLSGRGQTGLLATNTLAQGDTREVGLDQIVDLGDEIRMAIKSEPWPSKSAVLEYCAVWSSHAEVADAAPRKLNGSAVLGITSLLEPKSRATGKPERLTANRDKAFQGSIILGLGFTMEIDHARALIRKNTHYNDVLLPYLNGHDVNSRADCSASRWVINFQSRSEAEAEAYPECYDQVRRLVRPERLKVKFSKNAREYWWQYERRRPELYDAISTLEQVIVITLVSKVVMPVLVSSRQIFANVLGVFASSDTAVLAFLSSTQHYWWAISRASTMKGDLRYTPTDVFETLPPPKLTEPLRQLGSRLDSERRKLMSARREGLTKTYNRLHNSDCHDSDIANLREIHRLIDEEVCRAYGWGDLIDLLQHDHYDTRQGVRYTVAPAARQEILDRLLELNHERYAEEVAKGLHTKKKSTGKKRSASANGQASLF